MSFTRLSVLVPTRGRLPQLATLLASVKLTCHIHSPVEFVFRVDDDDPDSEHFLMDYPWPMGVGPKLHGYRSLPIFFEEMRHMASGDLFMCGNDDMVFRTPNWPELVLAEANKYPDGVFDLGVDTLNAGVFPFSIVSRKAVDAMGFLQDPRLTAGDVFLRDVMAHFGRAIRLPSVRVDHEWQGYTPEHPSLDHVYWALHKTAVAEAAAKLEVLYGTSQVNAS